MPDGRTYASPTTTRFVALVAALVSAGLFLGNWAHGELPAGADWTRRTAACSTAAATLPDVVPIAVTDAFHACIAAVERERAAYTLGGAGLALLLSLIVMAGAPLVIERRRRLRPARPRVPAAVERFGALAAAADVRAPTAMLGSTRVRDAFSYGRPGHYRVVLPPAIAVRWRDAAVFDPLVRHELAHVARHDVAFAWLARSAWYVVVPLLSVPLLWGPLTGDSSLLPSYSWRAAVLVAVTFLTARALLRSREHEADLWAAATEESARQLRGLLARIPPRRTSRWRDVVAYHPSGAERLAVLDRPERFAAVGFVGCLSVAFLAALTFPLLRDVLAITNGNTVLIVSSALIGLILGPTVGLALWRQSVARFRTGAGRSGAAVAVLGAFAGTALGRATSLAEDVTLNLSDQAVSALIGGLVVAGAAAAAAGLAEVFAGPRAGRAAARVFVVLACALFAVGVWVGSVLSFTFAEAGWALAGTAFVTILGGWPAAVVAVALAVGAAWALLRARGVEPPGPLRVRAAIGLGVAAGVTAAAVLVGFRILAGPAPDFAEQEQRYYGYLWVYAAAAAAVAIAFGLTMRTRGVGLALLAGPVASAVAIAGFLVLNVVLGGSTSAALLKALFTQGLSLGLILVLAAATLAVVPWPRPRPSLVFSVAAVAAVLSAAALSVGAVTARDRLVPFAALEAFASPAPPPSTGPSAEALAYSVSYVSDVERVLTVVESSVTSIDQALLDDADRAARIRLECLTPVATLLDDARTFQPTTPEVTAAHTRLLGVLELSARSFEDFATAYEQRDAEAFERARSERAEAQQDLALWRVAAAQLTVPRNEYGRQTCQTFARLVTGVATLTPDQVTETLSRMADSVARSADPTMMEAVVDLGQGPYAGDPQRFVGGMRTLSAICGVPYD